MPELYVAGHDRGITPRQFHEADGVEDWRVVGDGACAYFRTGSFTAGARLVHAISELPGLEDHHPDVRHGGVTVRLLTITDEHYGMSERDVELARQISAVARELSIPADPSAVQSVQVSIDALSYPGQEGVPASPGRSLHFEVMPFWRAVLGYRDRAPEDLIDPRGRGPSFWFQQMDAPRPQRNRIHIDVWVPHDQAESRIAAAIAAGGHLVTDEYAPEYWCSRTPRGTRPCLATTMGRN